MLNRRYKSRITIDDDGSKALPGLLSSLRPLHQFTHQIQQESTLLRRFTYKNKNQHKGCGWWRSGIVQVDRVMERVVTELQGLGNEFASNEEGIEGSEQKITLHHVVNGLIRLPRSLLLLEKALSVMLSSTSVLTQLIHSRAFLPFSTVVMALVARLHTLCSVLFDDLLKLAETLVKLIEYQHVEAVTCAFGRLPQSIQRVLPSLDAVKIKSNVEPKSDPEEYDDDVDYGAVVSRSTAVPAEIAAAQVPNQERGRSELGISLVSPLFTPDFETAVAVQIPSRSTQQAQLRADGEHREKIRSRSEGGADVKPKKQKKRRGTEKDEDEIDDIFG